MFIFIFIAINMNIRNFLILKLTSICFFISSKNVFLQFLFFRNSLENFVFKVFKSRRFLCRFCAQISFYFIIHGSIVFKKSWFCWVPNALSKNKQRFVSYFLSLLQILFPNWKGSSPSKLRATSRQFYTFIKEVLWYH